MSHHLTLPAFAVSRRAALAGSVAAGTAVAVTLTSPGALAAGRRRVVIGVLTSSVPGRTQLTERGDAFVAGLRVGLGPVARRVLRREVSGGYQGATSAAEHLIKAGAKVIVACLSDSTTQELAQLCARRKVALVQAGQGAQVAASSGRAGERATVLRATGQHWQSALATGVWAGRTWGGTMHHVVAAPDAGYDSVYALRRGFTSAGGTVVGLSLTHESGGLGPVVAQVRASKPRVVGISASGTRARQIVKALRAGGVRARFVLDSTVADDLGAFSGGADGAHLGGPLVVEQRRQELARALKRRGAGRVSAASIHGHDVGRLIAAGADRLGSRSWDRLPARLVGRSVPGVRGEQKVGADGQVSVPLAVWKVRKVAGRRRAVLASRRARIVGNAPAMTVVQGRLSSGYVNEYLTT